MRIIYIAAGKALSTNHYLGSCAGILVCYLLCDCNAGSF